MSNLIGRNVLIVDEVDDTRTTLEYAVKELQKDVETAAKQLGRTSESTKFSIFVLHNKDKKKRGTLPSDMMSENRYLAALTTEDIWICYPCTYILGLHYELVADISSGEATDIDEHDRLAAKQKAADEGIAANTVT